MLWKVLAEKQMGRGRLLLQSHYQLGALALGWEQLLLVGRRHGGQQQVRETSSCQRSYARQGFDGDELLRRLHWRQQVRALSAPVLSSSSSASAGAVGVEERGEEEVEGEVDGQSMGLSAAALGRRSQRKAIPRSMLELDRACAQMLWRRHPSEPIEVTLHRAQFPLTAPNLSLVLSRLRSARDALRLFLCFLRANPSFVPEKALLDAVSRFWMHERDRFQVFLSILEDIRNPACSMTPRRLTSLLRGYGWAGLVDDVLRFLSSCKASYGFQPDFIHYSCALHTCVQEKRLDIALQIFDQMKKDGKPPTYDTFQSVISGLFSVNQAKDAALIFEEMLSSELVKPGELPCRVVSYVTIVDELVGSDDLQQASVILMKMNDMGFMPDYVTCANVLKAFSRKGQVQALDELYDEMRAKGLVPDVDCLKKFVNDHCRESITAETQKLLNAVVSTIDSVTYFRTSEGEELLERTPPKDPEVSVEGPSSSICRQTKSSPTIGDGGVEGLDFMLFDRVIYSLCVYEKAEDAYELMLRMTQHPNCTTTLAASTSMILFDALCWAVKWEEAERFLRMMMKWEHMPGLKVYNVWIQGSCKAGRLENVNNFLNEFNHSDLVLDAISHDLVVEKLCMAGKLDEAKKVTMNTKSNLGTLDVVSYSRMIQSFAKAGDFEVPRKLLDEMVEMGINPFALPFSPLVQRLCLAGKMEEAVALVDEIEAKGCKPLPSLYTIIVSAYCKAKRLQDAFNVMDIMKSKGVTPEAQTHKDLFGSCIGTRALKPAVKA